MKKDFMFKAVLFPIVVSILLGIFSFAVITRDSKNLAAFDKGTTVFEFESESLDNNPVQAENGTLEKSSLKKNDLIGTIENTDLRYNADYSALNSSASVSPSGVLPSEDGCTYIRIGAQKALELGNGVVVDDAAGTWNFSLAEEKTAKSESEVLSYAPQFKNSLVVYYSESNGVGLTSHYKMIVYKGVG